MAISLTKRAAEEVKKIMEAQSLSSETVLRAITYPALISAVRVFKAMNFNRSSLPTSDGWHVLASHD